MHGPSNTRPLAVVETFNLETSKWHTDTALPQPIALSVPVAMNNASFMVVGGFNGTTGGDMAPKDLLRSILVQQRGHGSASSEWTEVAELPIARGFPSAAHVPSSPNGTLLVFGGYDALSRNDTTRVDALDLSSMTWWQTPQGFPCTAPSPPYSRTPYM